MKNPHDKSEYTQVDENASEQPIENAAIEQNQPTEQPPAEKPPTRVKKQKKPKFSGAYYYVHGDEKPLAEKAFIRTVTTIVAFCLQMVVIWLLPKQQYSDYIPLNLPSYALIYVLAVFVTIAVSIWLMVMNSTRYRFRKRIPVEYAPKKGFKRRAFFGNELYIAVNALITAMQISFACLAYDPITLVAVFLSAAATAAAVVARQVTHIALRDSELVPAAPDPEEAQTD